MEVALVGCNFLYSHSAAQTPAQVGQYQQAVIPLRTRLIAVAALIAIAAWISMLLEYTSCIMPAFTWVGSLQLSEDITSYYPQYLKGIAMIGAQLIALYILRRSQPISQHVYKFTFSLVLLVVMTGFLAADLAGIAAGDQNFNNLLWIQFVLLYATIFTLFFPAIFSLVTYVAPSQYVASCSGMATAAMLVASALPSRLLEGSSEQTFLICTLIVTVITAGLAFVLWSNRDQVNEELKL